MRKRTDSLECRPVDRVRACVLMISLLMLGSGAVAQEPDRIGWALASNDIGGGSATDPPTAEDVIEAMYAKAQSMLEGSGHEVTVALDDYRHLSLDELDTVPWLDLVTVDGRRLELGKHFLTLNDHEKRFVHVSAEWKDAQSPEALEKVFRLAPIAHEVAAVLDRPDFG